MCKTAEAYVQDHMLELSEHMPAMVVGNGPNYGVAEEAALKLSETIKIPAMHHEGEEFVHGPEMQIVPGYLVFIVDDPQGSERLANIADALSNVTAKTVLLTAHPKVGLTRLWCLRWLRCSVQFPISCSSRRLRQ